MIYFFLTRQTLSDSGITRRKVPLHVDLEINVSFGRKQVKISSPKTTKLAEYGKMTWYVS